MVVAQALTGLEGDVAQIRGALEPDVRRVIDEATASDPADRYTSVGALVGALHRALGSREIAPLTTAAEIENPYKGLRSFGAADAGDFFGRERLVDRLLARLGDQSRRGRFVAVVGHRQRRSEDGLWFVLHRPIHFLTISSNWSDYSL